jgi:dihydrofolate reductase
VSIALVVALDRRRAIGRGNALPWHLPDDLKRFKALTFGRPILMGGNTARSIGRALPGRRNLVLTRAPQAPFDGMQVVRSVDEAIVAAAGEPLMVIGGGEVYALTLPRADVLHLTCVDTVVEGADAFFPDWREGGWAETCREAHAADARHAFAFEYVDLRRPLSA